MRGLIGAIGSQRVAGGGGGSVVYRGRASKSSTTTSLSVAQADFDVAPVSGDLLLMAVVVFGDAKTCTPETTPSGWTQNTRVNLTGGEFLTLYKKIAGGSEGTYTIPGMAAVLDAWACVVTASGATLVDAVSSNGAIGAGGTANMSLPSISPTGSTDLLLGFWASLNNTSAPTVPGSMTSIATAAPAGSVQMRCVAAKENLSSSGATGTRVATRPSSSSDWVGLLVAIK